PRVCTSWTSWSRAPWASCPSTCLDSPRPHLRVPGLRVLPGHLDPREREFPLRPLAVGARHAAVPPLAPQRRVRSGGQEFRRALARDRSRLRDLPSARLPVARPLRPGGRSCPRELCSAARLPV